MNNICMSIDMKKYRIRLHKTTLKLLGNPSSVQFLINPEKKQILLRNMDDCLEDITVLKIHKFQKNSDCSIDFYSIKLVKMIQSAAGTMDEKSCYRLYGKLHPTKKFGLFSFNNVEQVTE